MRLIGWVDSRHDELAQPTCGIDDGLRRQSRIARGVDRDVQVAVLASLFSDERVHAPTARQPDAAFRLL